MKTAILGIGQALPEHSLTQAKAAETALRISGTNGSQAKLISKLFSRSGIESRGCCVVEQPDANGDGGQIFFPLSEHENDEGPTTETRMLRYAEEAGPLAIRAVRAAMDESGLRPDEITHLVTVSCTGFYAPGIDLTLINEMGLRSTVERVHVGFMGCHGALNGLRVARGLCAADPGARVLLCAIELCTLHFQYGWERDNMVANALFADGSAAMVLAAAREFPGAAYNLAATGSCYFPDSADAMTWRIANNGFKMTLSARVPDLIGACLKPWMREWLGKLGHSLENLGSYAVHPGGPRILNAVEEALNLPESALGVSREILSRFGNMSSPTVLFIINQLRQMKAPLPWLALGFGPGLAGESALIV